MASTKIRGITIELGADTSQLTKAFKDVSKELNAVDKNLKDVNKLLKLDPKNVELLGQKQDYLSKAIELTQQKLEEEKKLLAEMPSADDGSMTEQQKALQREIAATTAELDKYQSELKETNAQSEKQTGIIGTIKEKFGDLKGKVSEVGDHLAKFGQAMQGVKAGFELVSGGVKLAIDAYNEFVGDTVKMADSLMEQSSVTGLSTDALQEYAYMAELVDTDVSTITGSMQKMIKNMSSAKSGTGDAAKAFEALGISVTDSNGELRDQNEVFSEALAALGSMENETEKNALAMQIFGKSAMELNPLIDAGAEAIDEYRQQAHDMGYVLDNETLEALGGVDDTMQVLGNQFDAVKQQIAVALLPIVEEITTAFLDWAKSVDWKAVGNTIKTVMQGIGAAINAVIPIIKTIIEWFGKIVSAIKAVFTTKWEWPHIKMPHFGIVPKGWKVGDLLKGIIPKLNIEWYAKGMEGMVLDGATIFGINNKGQLMGGGERGREIIIGENKLKSMMGGTTINIAVNEVNNPEATAQAVMNRLQLALNTQERTWK